MTRREQLQENYEEALFALLMDDLAVSEGKKAIQENRLLREDPQAAVPERVDRRCIRTIRRCFSANTSRTAARVLTKVINRVAIVVLVCTMLFTVAFAVSTDFRLNTLNYVIDTFDDRARLSPETSGSYSIVAGWLPQGYELTEYSQEQMLTFVQYKTSDNREIQIVVSDASKRKTIDTEDAAVTTILINQYQATAVSKQGTNANGHTYEENRVVWLDSEHKMYIDVYSCHEDIATLVHIAEQLTFQ